MSNPTAGKSKRPKGTPGIWRIAISISPGRSLLVLLYLTLAGAVEGIGIASLLPLLALMSGGSQMGGIGEKITVALDSLGLSLNLGLLLGVLIGGMLLKALLMLIAMRQVGHAVAEVSMRMRLNLVDALLAARWGYYVHQPVGRFTNALGSEASQAGVAYNAVAQFLANIIQALVYLSLAALVSWHLALLSLAVGILMVLSLNRLVIMAKRTAKLQNKQMRKMISRLTDVLAGIKPMKAMGRHARFGSLFFRDVEQINLAMRRQLFARQTNKALQEPIIAVCLAIGIYCALTFWNLPMGEVLVMALLLAKTVSSIGSVQQDLQAVKVAEAGYWSIVTTIEETRDARESPAGILTPSFESGLEFRGVSFAYGRKQIIAGASFHVPAGKVTAITGPSGAGKTTLVDLMLGLQEPDAGEVLLDGVPLPQIDILQWRRMTGYVPQEVMLFHDTVMGNVTLGEPEYDAEAVERALRQSGAWDFVCQLPDGMQTVVGERGTALSGGQRQRIAVARALVHQPRVLILDEATSALDPATEITIVNNICDLARQTGLTVLSISHQPAWVRAATRVIQVGGGSAIDISKLDVSHDTA